MRHAREVRQRQRAIAGARWTFESEGQLWIGTGKRASRELFLDCRQLGNKRKTPKSSGQVLVNTVNRRSGPQYPGRAYRVRRCENAYTNRTISIWVFLAACRTFHTVAPT
jgi:hypothetical protein